MYNRAKEEREEFIKSNNYSMFAYTDDELNEELKSSLQDLLDSNILFQGIRPSCPYCGFRNWYDLKDINTELICKGCHKEFKFPTEIGWYYRLNELIKRTIIFQGVMATLLCLGNILQFSRESFLFFPNICLFKDYENEESDVELDIICISDGNFIIGEVKNSAKLFYPSDFDKIGEVALKLRPDKIIIYAFEGPYKKVEELTNELNNKMKSYILRVPSSNLHFL